MLAITTLLIGMTFSIVMLQMGSGYFLAASSRGNKQAAANLAEAGLEYAYWQVNNNGAALPLSANLTLSTGSIQITAVDDSATVAGSMFVTSTATSGNYSYTTTRVMSIVQSNLVYYVYYKFDETHGSTAADSSGNGYTATLISSARFRAGKYGNGVSLNGTSSYVKIPSGILKDTTDFTVSAWVKLNAVHTWDRIFDFGGGRSINMFLTPLSGDGTIRYSITTVGWWDEQRINGTSSPSLGVWHHIAVTLSGTTGTLYVDGVQVGQNNNMTLNPSSLGNLSQNYIGKSQYTEDPYLNGMVDDFKIYDRALSSSEITDLFNQ